MRRTRPMAFRAGEMGFFGEPVLTPPEELGADMTIPLRSQGRRKAAAAQSPRPGADHPDERATSPAQSRSNVDPGLGSSPRLFASSVNHFCGVRATLCLQESKAHRGRATNHAATARWAVRGLSTMNSTRNRFEPCQGRRPPQHVHTHPRLDRSELSDLSILHVFIAFPVTVSLRVDI
jgi:hypothetical protein